ncbi:MAG: M55 family metallopeptidase [Gemmatimonadota bacterium]
MRVFISVDMEGVAGVVHDSQTNPIEPRFAGEYNRFRRLMTLEANAAIEGAMAGGATQILVNDSHWEMRNLLAEELHPAAELISGGPKIHSMMEGVAGGADAAFFIGYHAKAGTQSAIIDHTYTDCIQDVRLNGRSVGELGINAALAGCFNVPVVLVSGDSALAAEAGSLLGPNVSTVVVKEAVSRHAARSVAPSVACDRIREAAAVALQRRPYPDPLLLDSPITIEVDFSFTAEADGAEGTPGVVRVAGRTVAFQDPDYREVFKAFRSMYNLAGSA